jgi:hypothetical protein
MKHFFKKNFNFYSIQNFAVWIQNEASVLKKCIQNRENEFIIKLAPYCSARHHTFENLNIFVLKGLNLECAIRCRKWLLRFWLFCEDLWFWDFIFGESCSKNFNFVENQRLKLKRESWSTLQSFCSSILDCELTGNFWQHDLIHKNF